MEALATEVKESCSAAVLDGSDIVYVLRVPTHRLMSITLGIGLDSPVGRSRVHHDLAPNFTTWVGGGVQIQVPLAGHHVGHLGCGQRR